MGLTLVAVIATLLLFLSATSVDSPLAHVVVSSSATCAGGAYVYIYIRMSVYV